jgi:hypothetical protein
MLNHSLLLINILISVDFAMLQCCKTCRTNVAQLGRELFAHGPSSRHCFDRHNRRFCSHFVRKVRIKMISQLNVLSRVGCGQHTVLPIVDAMERMQRSRSEFAEDLVATVIPTFITKTSTRTTIAARLVPIQLPSLRILL